MRERALRGRERLALLVLLVTVALGAAGGAIAVLLDVAMTEQRRLLAGLADGQARLIEAVGQFDQRFSQDFPAGAMAATLEQVRRAARTYGGLGRSGELVLAHRTGDAIEFLVAGGDAERALPRSVPWRSGLAEPMRAALSGAGRVLVGRDYDGTRVLAAAEPLPALGWGLVAKVDLDEIRRPFVRAALLALGITLLLAAAGAVLFFRITDPLLRRLATNEARFRALFESAPLGIGLVQQDGRVALSNPALQRILGRDAQTLSTQGFGEFTHPDDVAADLTQYRALWAGDIRGYHLDKRYLRPDGSLVWGHLTVALMQGADGRPLGAVGMVEDITAAKRMQAELQEAQEKSLQMEKLSALGTFVGGIAHEIKNPLMGLSNYIAHVEANLADPAMLDVLARAQTQVRRIGRIVDGVLGYARGDDSELHRLDPAQVAADVVLLVQSELKRWSVQLLTDTPETPLAVISNRDALSQALLNLVLNAIQALRDVERRELCIGISARGGRVAISVCDTGPGVPADIRRRIYDPFFTTKPPGEGTGLGLSVALRGIESVGGELKLTDNPGGGACFTLLLPAATRDEPR
ncbi:ATP-binding protein [uncultured Thiohalocapsa sp.]|mgnify:CR=1 FL=1|uniref:two-component system sensor histidine kinase NtrB n=1 Tax=uncultured Thiohalocapsa sp. TaxID=768990 RepID=UPI0025D0EC09|nr:ATP-binding protein [uncultured Thiohalocapsa sp.]